MKRLTNDDLCDHHGRLGSAHVQNNYLPLLISAPQWPPLTSTPRLLSTCSLWRWSCKTSKPLVSAGQKTAHETLLAPARWKRNCCFGGAVQRGEFRAVSGYINGLREGYKAVTAPGFDGPYRAYGQLATNEPTEDLDAFRKFTKDKSNREKADIPEEARKKAVELATELAADGQNSFMKAPFSMGSFCYRLTASST